MISIGYVPVSFQCKGEFFFESLSLPTKRNRAKELNDFEMYSFTLVYLHGYYESFFSHQNNEIFDAEKGSTLV